LYTDFIRYRLAPGITEETLLQSAEDVHTHWMSKQPGFLSWQINRLTNEKGYMDIVQWESKDAAKSAEANMKDLPPDCLWFQCYEMNSIISENGTKLGGFSSKK
jgi:hypothetical protein